MNTTKYSELVKLFSNFRKRQIGLFFLSTAAILLNLYFVYQIQDFVDVITDGTGMERIWEAFLKSFWLVLRHLSWESGRTRCGMCSGIP